MGGSMRKLVFVFVFCLLSAVFVHAENIPSPEEHFGHIVGADRTMIPYPDVLAYLELVAAASDRVSIEEAGTSTLGNRMPVVVLTSAFNQTRLEEIRERAMHLALPGGMSADNTQRLIETTPAVALVTCTIHASEVGSTQMTTEFVFEFADATFGFVPINDVQKLMLLRAVRSIRHIETALSRYLRETLRLAVVCDGDGFICALRFAGQAGK